MNKESEVVKGVSSSGSPLYHPLKYKWSEEDKCMVPYFDKPLNRYEMIQASKDSTDIHAIINIVKLGDVSVLNVNPGVDDIDVSEMPNNINDAVQLQSNVMNQFINLDPKLRALFNNDFNEFSKAVSDNTYIDIINKGLAPVSNESEVKENA